MSAGSFVHRYRRVVLEVLLVLVVALVPRLTGLGTFLTADEKNWVGRGFEFVRAIAEFRFNDTLQTTHPGIPTLWISGLSTSRLADVPFSFDEIRRFVTASQYPIAVVNSLLVVGIFLATRRLFAPRLALIASLAVALDPFLIGHSRIVHVDALLAGFTMLTLLLFLTAVRTTAAGLFVASAFTGALAILSKLPGLALLPFAALVLFTEQSIQSVRERLRSLLRWVFLIAVTILVFWPGLLWVPDPLGNVKIVKRDVVVAVSTPHHMAEDYTLKPWHYPATLLTRTTIPTLIGFLLFLLVFSSTVRRRSTTWGARLPSGEFSGAPATSPAGCPVPDVVPGRSRSSEHHRDSFFRLLGTDRRTLTLLLAFLPLFLAVMTVGAKKSDRYVLPLFPVIDILAVFGVAGTIAALRPRFPAPRTLALTAALVLLPLGVEALRLGPYALAHYNRLFPPNLSQELGWGEGLDQVATYLNALPDEAHVAAASWYPSELGALTSRRVFHLNSHEQLRVGYIVLYRNMFGRPPDHPANDFLDRYYRQQTPVFVATVNGLPYAWVYRRPAFTGVLDELLPRVTVVGELPVTEETLSGVEVYVATYLGRARSGTLVLRLREALDSPVLRETRVPVRAAEDNTWVRFSFAPLSKAAGKTYLLTLEAEGTKRGNAPTVRFAPHEPNAPRYGLLRAPAELTGAFARSQGRGLLGIRPVSTAQQ